MGLLATRFGLFVVRLFAVGTGALNLSGRFLKLLPAVMYVYGYLALADQMRAGEKWSSAQSCWRSRLVKWCMLVVAALRLILQNREALFALSAATPVKGVLNAQA